MPLRALARISKTYPLTIIGGWCGPSVQLHAPALPQGHRRLQAVFCVQDQLCPLPSQWLEDQHLVNFCQRHSIACVILEGGFDSFAIIGKAGHSWGHILLHPKIHSLNGIVSCRDLRDHGIGPRATDNVVYMLLVAAMIIHDDRRVIDITDILPHRKEVPTTVLRPWHHATEQPTSEENKRTLTTVVRALYHQLPPVAKVLYDNRIGPEVDKEVFKLPTIRRRS